MSKQLTPLVTYPGLVLHVKDRLPGDQTNTQNVRIVTGQDQYRIIGRISGPQIVHAISSKLKSVTFSARRNCTRAEAMMLGMDVDKRAKVGDFVIIFEMSNRGCDKVLWFNGIYAVTEMWKAGPYALLVKGSDNGITSPGAVILTNYIDYMVINWKGS